MVEISDRPLSTIMPSLISNHTGTQNATLVHLNIWYYITLKASCLVFSMSLTNETHHITCPIMRSVYEILYNIGVALIEETLGFFIILTFGL